MEYEDLFTLNIINLSDEQLIELRNRLEFEHGKIAEEWSIELASFAKENFDPYSFWGKRKIEKLNKKYAPKTADILNLMEDIEKELFKRDRLKYQKMFDGKDNDEVDEIDRNEFFEKEELKTLKHKQDLED